MKKEYVVPQTEVYEEYVADGILLNDSPGAGGNVGGAYIDEGDEEAAARMRYYATTGEEFGNLW